MRQAAISARHSRCDTCAHIRTRKNVVVATFANESSVPLARRLAHPVARPQLFFGLAMGRSHDHEALVLVLARAFVLPPSPQPSPSLPSSSPSSTTTRQPVAVTSLTPTRSPLAHALMPARASSSPKWRFLTTATTTATKRARARVRFLDKMAKAVLFVSDSRFQKILTDFCLFSSANYNLNIVASDAN